MTSRGRIDVKIGDIQISSSFDSGNLDGVEPCQVPLEYNLWTAPDCAGTSYENGNRTWFYFSVRIPRNYSSNILRFHLQNLNKQLRLYQQRMVPFFRVVPGKSSWERLRGTVEWQMGEEGLILSFQYVIQDSRSHTVYFSFCYPYSYSDCQHKLNSLDQKFTVLAHKRLYYHRELLCYTLEGRRVDMLTITSIRGITEDREPRLEGLFPDTTTERSHCFTGKKVFFVTSRVHPGETPASHVFNGLLDFLLREDDERAEAVRDNFVVKMIPMLNPDGVAHGHYRTDTRGVNLNRVYLNPDHQLHPSIFAARSIMLYHHKRGVNNKDRMRSDLHKPTSLNTSTCILTRGKQHRSRGGSAKVQVKRAHSGLMMRCRSLTYPVTNTHVHVHSHTESLKDSSQNQCLWDDGNSAQKSSTIMKEGTESGIALYVDLHAHATKRGCFFYGNFFKEEKQQVENMLYPRLVGLNSPHLDFEHCVFSERNMYSSDKRDGTSKDGSGRVALHKATGLIRCYTLECNYNSGRQSNAVSSATCDNGQASPALPYSPMPHRYSIASFEQVGRALAVALLDLHSLNPWTRLPTTEHGSLVALRAALTTRIKNSRAKIQDRKREEYQCSTTCFSSGLCSLPSSKEPQWHEKLRPQDNLSPQLLLAHKSHVTLRKTAQIALDVSQLTELTRAQKCQLEVSMSKGRYNEDGRTYEVPRVKNVVFPDLKRPVNKPDSCKHSTCKKVTKAKSSKRLLPRRAEGSPCHTAIYINNGTRSVQLPSSRTMCSKLSLPPT